MSQQSGTLQQLQTLSPPSMQGPSLYPAEFYDAFCRLDDRLLSFYPSLAVGINPSPDIQNGAAITLACKQGNQSYPLGTSTVNGQDQYGFVATFDIPTTSPVFAQNSLLELYYTVTNPNQATVQSLSFPIVVYRTPQAAAGAASGTAAAMGPGSAVGLPPPPSISAMAPPPMPPANMPPGTAPNMPPGMAPNMPPGMAPNMQPGMAPNMQPGMGPNMQPGMGPNMQPGMGPNMQPGMAPNMPPGMAPNMPPNMRPNMPPNMPPMPPMMRPGGPR